MSEPKHSRDAPQDGSTGRRAAALAALCLAVVLTGCARRLPPAPAPAWDGWIDTFLRQSPDVYRLPEPVPGLQEGELVRGPEVLERMREAWLIASAAPPGDYGVSPAAPPEDKPEAVVFSLIRALTPGSADDALVGQRVRIRATKEERERDKVFRNPSGNEITWGERDRDVRLQGYNHDLVALGAKYEASFWRDDPAEYPEQIVDQLTWSGFAADVPSISVPRTLEAELRSRFADLVRHCSQRLPPPAAQLVGNARLTIERVREVDRESPYYVKVTGTNVTFSAPIIRALAMTIEGPRAFDRLDRRDLYERALSRARQTSGFGALNEQQRQLRDDPFGIKSREESIVEELARQRPGYLSSAILRMDAELREKERTLLNTFSLFAAHEIGHVWLGHTSSPVAGFRPRLQREFAADVAGIAILVHGGWDVDPGGFRDQMIAAIEQGAAKVWNLERMQDIADVEARYQRFSRTVEEATRLRRTSPDITLSDLYLRLEDAWVSVSEPASRPAAAGDAGRG